MPITWCINKPDNTKNLPEIWILRISPPETTMSCAANTSKGPLIVSVYGTLLTVRGKSSLLEEKDRSVAVVPADTVTQMVVHWVDQSNGSIMSSMISVGP